MEGGHFYTLLPNRIHEIFSLLFIPVGVIASHPGLECPKGFRILNHTVLGALENCLCLLGEYFL